MAKKFSNSAEINRAIRSVSGAVSLSYDDQYIEITGASTITLPTIIPSMVGQRLEIFYTTTGTVTHNASGGNTINGSASYVAGAIGKAEIEATSLTTWRVSFSNAQQGQSDAYLLDRANHTGTQLASTISDFSTAVASNAAVAANTAKVTNATHTGEVTGATALTITANAVTNAKLAQMATATFKGRTTAGTGNTEDLTVAQVRALIPPVFTESFATITSSGAGAWVVRGTAQGITAPANRVVSINVQSNVNNAIVGVRVAGSALNRLIQIDNDSSSSFLVQLNGTQQLEIYSTNGATQFFQMGRFI